MPRSIYAGSMRWRCRGPGATRDRRARHRARG
jgi:hypothetical protein